jgi:uncharacterized protein DUF6895
MLKAEPPIFSWQKRPTHEEVQLVSSRARNWLLALHERIGSEIALSRLLQILVGCWICKKGLAADTEQRECLAVARTVQVRLDQALSRPDASSALLECDATIVLLSAGILRALGRDSETLTRFVDQVACGIRELGDEDQTTATGLFGLKFLLSRLNCPSGIDTHQGWYEVASLLSSPDVDLFHLDGAAISSVCARLAAMTMFGRRSLSAEVEPLRQLAVVVPIWMISYLREYKIDIGATLLRTLSYLRLQDDRFLSAGLNFLLAQQQPGGYFGFLAPSMSRLFSTRTDLNGELDIYLPLTILCLWAVAETVSHDFLLFESINS